MEKSLYKVFFILQEILFSKSLDYSPCPDLRCQFMKEQDQVPYGGRKLCSRGLCGIVTETVWSRLAPLSRASHRSETTAAVHSSPAASIPARPINKRAGGTPLVRPEKGAEKKRAEKMDLKCEESMSMRPTTQEFHRSPTSATDS